MSTRLPTLNIPNPVPDGVSPPPVSVIPGAVVHSLYDPHNVPPKPADGRHWTRFICISDTHEQIFPIPDGDVLLHSGDLTSTGMFRGVLKTMDWLCSLPHPKKIIIAGNHDLTFHKDWYKTEWIRWHRTEQDPNAIMYFAVGPQAKEAGLVYLENEVHEFQLRPNGRVWSVYGSPWTPEFYNWAFNYNRGQQADEIVSSFPKTDILLTHGPPYSILDMTNGQTHVGCESLLARLPALRPRLHVFGHIHEAHGVQIGEWLPACSRPNAEPKEHTVFVNAAAWPDGDRKRTDGQRVPFGEGPFAPVIVDLLDEP
ncbi:Metallo-dependent phosphatase [Auriscalpium vulgare]|uniref:Metallo-dependent phosphatase n=1 Tax=Auriscalpium vulgare TaxID=40419 RepID=A0ACB8SBR6_9AGAM|nr:Metallo-dependent phosphatase [Auriscalpium vulgare]